MKPERASERVNRNTDDVTESQVLSVAYNVSYRLHFSAIVGLSITGFIVFILVFGVCVHCCIRCHERRRRSNTSALPSAPNYKYGTMDALNSSDLFFSWYGLMNPARLYGTTKMVMTSRLTNYTGLQKEFSVRYWFCQLILTNFWAGPESEYELRFALSRQVF